jgi:4-amino-4-deoxychorismate lyase
MIPVLSTREISILLGDRGLAYGDGLFETMRVEGGRVPLLHRHLDRLFAGCERLGMPLPERGALAARAEGLAESAGAGVVKVVVTRGAGSRGYRPPEKPDLRVMTEIHPLPDIPRSHYTEGVSLQVCTTRIGRSPATAGLKHLGRLEQVLASSELRGDCAEGLMLDEHGHVIEGTRCNLFLVRAGDVFTPRLDMSGVAGVMRTLVLETAGALHLRASEVLVSMEDLVQADEILLTNAVIGIWPVSRIDEMQWRRVPGPVGRRLMTAVSAEGVPSWSP